MSTELGAPASRELTDCGVSSDDRAFLERFATGALAAAGFGHREHVRLGYCLLARHGLAEASGRMQAALLGFLTRHDVPSSKYDAALTHAWLDVLADAMACAEPTASASELISRHPELLDARRVSTRPPRGGDEHGQGSV